MIEQVHGGNAYSLDAELDFSANINPLGIPESVKKAVTDSSELWGSYPDPFCTDLRNAISEHEKISSGQIVCGNGADDLIYRIVSAFRPKSAVICAPSFGEYKKALCENGCIVREYFMSDENDFVLTDKILDMLTPDTDILFICTPNNPTGRTIAPDLLKKIAEKCLDNNIFLVCDECFIDFTEDVERFSVRNYLNEKIIILKAFTKIYAMAGLRLGYGIFGSPSAAEAVRYSGQYWSVSVPAQTAGIAALSERDYIKRTVGLIKREREFLTSELLEAGIKVYRSEANFLLLRSSLPLYELLLRDKILIRNCRSYSGLGDDFFRIAVRTREENTRLISAVRRIMNG